MKIAIKVYAVPNKEDPIESASHYLKQNHWELEQFQTIYHPYFFTEWEIIYRSFFKRKRVNRKIVANNAVTGGTSFADEFPDFIERDKEETTIIPVNHTSQSSILEAKEMVRRYYIHHVRVWNLPVITPNRGELIYLPYTILNVKKEKSDKRQVFLLEQVSGNIDKLKNFPQIEDAYNQLFERREAR